MFVCAAGDASIFLKFEGFFSSGEMGLFTGRTYKSKEAQKAVDKGRIEWQMWANSLGVLGGFSTSTCYFSPFAPLFSLSIISLSSLTHTV